MPKPTENEVQVAANTLNTQAAYIHNATEEVIVVLERVAGQVPADRPKESVGSDGTLGILGARLADLRANLAHIQRLALNIADRIGSD